MRYHHQICLLFAALMVFSGACQKNKPEENNPQSLQKNSLYAADNLVAWCVVPFDKMNRGPFERAKMLNELGFRKFAYDWRDQHLATFPEEVASLNEFDIELTSVWWWIDGQGENLLSEGNQQLLDYVDSLDITCDIWMSFDDRFFEGLNDSLKLEKATDAVISLHEKIAPTGARLQLYNHGAWFGKPSQPGEYN